MDITVLAENVVQTLLRGALLLSFVLWSSLDLPLALFAFGVSDVAATAVMIAMLSRGVLPERQRLVPARRDTKEIIGFAVPLWLSGMLRQFRRNIEVLLLGALSVATDVAVFAVAARVNLLGRVAYLSILGSVKPIVASLHDRGDRVGLTRIYATATRWTFSFSLPFFLLVVFLREPILDIFGTGFAAGSSALLILAGAELVNAATGVGSSVMDMTGHSRLKLVNSIAWAFIQIGGAAILIPAYGVVGAALARFLAITLVNVAIVVQMMVLEKLSPYDLAFWKPTGAALGAALAGLAMSVVWPADAGVAILVVHATMIVAVYGALLLTFGFEDDDHLVLDRVRIKFRPGRVRRESARST